MKRSSKLIGCAIAAILLLNLATTVPAVTQAATATVVDGECITAANHDPCMHADCYLSVNGSTDECRAFKCATNNGWRDPVSYKWCRNSTTSNPTCRGKLTSNTVDCTLVCDYWTCDYGSGDCLTTRPASTNTCRCSGPTDGTAREFNAFDTCT